MNRYLVTWYNRRTGKSGRSTAYARTKDQARFDVADEQSGYGRWGDVETSAVLVDYHTGRQ